MRKYLILVLTIFTTVACQQKKKPEKPAFAITKNDSESAKARQKSFENIEKFYNQQRAGFSFRSLNNCTNGSEIIYEQDHPTDQIFDVYTEVSDSSVSVDFKFNSSCCQIFEGLKTATDSVLLLDYKQKNEEVCECLCTYRHVFHLRNNNYKKILLNNEIVWESE